jgi:hypothetical protein
LKERQRKEKIKSSVVTSKVLFALACGFCFELVFEDSKSFPVVKKKKHIQFFHGAG